MDGSQLTPEQAAKCTTARAACRLSQQSGQPNAGARFPFYDDLFIATSLARDNSGSCWRY